MRTCLCIKPDLEEQEGYAKCKICNNWFNTALWKTHWEDKKNAAIAGKKLGRNDPCHCGSGKKFKKCCIPSGKRRLWVLKKGDEKNANDIKE